MVEKKNLRKGIAIGILVLFVGIGIIPIAGSISVEKHSSMIGSVRELNTVTKTESRRINVILHGKMGNNGWYVGPVWFEVTADNDTEIVMIRYRIDGSGWLTYTAPFKISTDGIHFLELKIYDQYGNEWYFSFDFKIDMTLPMVCLSKEVFINKIIYTAYTADNTSGVDRVEFYLNAELQHVAYAPGPYVWTLSPIPHQGYVRAVAYDMAGNNVSSPQQINRLIQNLIHNLMVHHQMMS